MRPVLMLLMMLLAGPGYAIDDAILDLCFKEAQGDTRDHAGARQQCRDQAYQRWDARLNTHYQQLMNKLDNEQKALLRASQRQWITFRDSEIAAIRKLFPGLAHYRDMKIIDLIAQRATTLENYYGPGLQTRPMENRVFRDDRIGISFAYPENWAVETDCESKEEYQCRVMLYPTSRKNPDSSIRIAMRYQLAFSELLAYPKGMGFVRQNYQVYALGNDGQLSPAEEISRNGWKGYRGMAEVRIETELGKASSEQARAFINQDQATAIIEVGTDLPSTHLNTLLQAFEFHH